MKSLLLAAALLLSAIAPVAAAGAPLRFQAPFDPYLLRIVVHFPEGEGREQESLCSPEQVGVLNAYFTRYLGFEADSMVAAHLQQHPEARDKAAVISVDFGGGCHADGGIILSRFAPDQNFATQLYEPGTGWRIVG